MTPQRDPTAASSPSPSVESGNPCPSVIQTPPPGYKRTEVGVIPEDWEVTTLGEICTFENGDRGRNYPSPGSFTQSGVPFINAGHLVEGRIDVSEMNYITPEVYKRLGSGKVQVGDILFCLRGSLGKFGIVREGFGKGAIASSLVIVRPRATTISRDYLGFYFNSALCAEMIDTWSGGAAQPNLGARDLARFYITFPPTIDEQRAIAEVLSDVDALLAALEHLIAKKRAIKQGAMQQLLTGKTRLPGFTGEWKIQPFDQVFRKQNAKSYQIPTSEYLEHGVYPVIDQGKALIVAYSDLSKKLYHCPLDGVIIFGDHTRIVKYADFDFLVGADGTQLLTVQENCSTKFFYYQLSVKEIPNTGYNRHLKFLKEFLFEVPPLPEQRAIAEVLSDMDAEIAALEARREKTRAIKQGMMQELLTGRIRLIENG